MFTMQQLKEACNDSCFQEFIGKKALICLSQFYNGEPVTRSQDFGEIVGFEDGMLILEKLEGRKFYPATYEAVILAPRGTYILDSTGEEIHNPDFLISWRLNLADNLQESQWISNSAPHFSSIVGKEWNFVYEFDEPFQRKLIETRAGDFIGKKIVVGISEHNNLNSEMDELNRKRQFYGEIIRINFSEGIIVKCKDGAEFSLPPDISLLQKPPAGEYTLESTKEVIANPELMTIWHKNIASSK
jgi:hypothetical protein